MLRRLLASIRSTEPPSDDSTRIVVGLGNPGVDYCHTRHNAGFMIADEVVARIGESESRERYGAIVTEGNYLDMPIVVVKPRTYMNRSGVAVDQVVRHYQLDLERLLIVYDDLDISFGRLQIRPSGSAGGHNGMKSVLGLLQTTNVPRLRFGIGRPVRGPAIDYVLGEFDAEQQELLPSLVSTAADAVEVWLRDGIQVAMNQYNRTVSSRSG